MRIMLGEILVLDIHILLSWYNHKNEIGLGDDQEFLGIPVKGDT